MALRLLMLKHNDTGYEAGREFKVLVSSNCKYVTHCTQIM